MITDSVLEIDGLPYIGLASSSLYKWRIIEITIILLLVTYSYTPPDAGT